MDAVIGKMRADFVLVAASRRESGEWTEADEKEIGAAIKAAIDKKDQAMLACWSRWLADLSAWVTAWTLVCRGSERRMREAAKATSNAVSPVAGAANAAGKEGAA